MPKIVATQEMIDALRACSISWGGDMLDGRDEDGRIYLDEELYQRLIDLREYGESIEDVILRLAHS